MRRAVAVLGAIAWFALSASAAGQDPNLRQRIAAEQRIVTGPKVLSGGHVDIGPRFVDREWTVLIHDDAAKAGGGGESVWRPTEDTVLQVTDDAVLQVPDDPAYAFLGADPGADVHVVPQTQNPDVVWVGWNTQDPEVMESIDRGVTMTLEGVQGPGRLVVYLQSGDFGEPEVLWDSTASGRSIWVDVNTHTHANWVFSEPGVYLVRVEVAADLVDGAAVSDTRELRFAVGSRTDPDAALTASWQGPAAEDDATARPAGAQAEPGASSPATLVVIVAGGLGLAAGLATVLLRGRRVKHRARSGQA